MRGAGKDPTTLRLPQGFARHVFRFWGFGTGCETVLPGLGDTVEKGQVHVTDVSFTWYYYPYSYW